MNSTDIVHNPIASLTMAIMPPSVVEKRRPVRLCRCFPWRPGCSAWWICRRGCAEETAWPFLQPVLFPGEPDIDSIADPAERKRRILLKQFYVSGIIGTFRAALSGSIMTTPPRSGTLSPKNCSPASRRICKCHRNRKQRSSQRHHRKPVARSTHSWRRGKQVAPPSTRIRRASTESRGRRNVGRGR